jgi:hypothetical protein
MNEEFRLRMFENRAVLRKILWHKKDEVTWECRKTLLSVYLVSYYSGHEIKENAVG